MAIFYKGKLIGLSKRSWWRWLTLGLAVKVEGCVFHIFLLLFCRLLWTSSFSHFVLLSFSPPSSPSFLSSFFSFFFSPSSSLPLLVPLLHLLAPFPPPSQAMTDFYFSLEKGDIVGIRYSERLVKISFAIHICSGIRDLAFNPNSHGGWASQAPTIRIKYSKFFHEIHDFLWFYGAIGWKQ